MNFELKTLSLASAAKTSTDTLIVLISEHFQAGKDPLSELIQKAIQAKDFASKAGKSLQAYAVQGIAASKIILVGVGEGKPVSLHSGLMSAMATLKAAETSKALVVLRGPPKRLKCMPRCWHWPKALTSMARPIPSPGLANCCK